MSEREGPPTHLEDRDLAAAAGGGERVAAEQLVRRVLPTVRRVARALLGNPTEAEDATQLALLEILRAASTYRGVGPLEAWARRIASRLVLRHARRNKPPEHASMLPLEGLEGGLTPFGELRPLTMSTRVIDELPRPLEEYLIELPEVQRVAVVLRHALGHTVPEIAELTGAPIPTVKSRIKKAHEELRRLVRRDLNIGVRFEVKSS